jgi:Uncharacterized oxidoreductases, Fe-dependent alcohol dehydrogenase family
MINFEFSIPTQIKFGRDAHLETGAMMKRLGRKAMIHYGSERVKHSGLVELIEKQLTDEGLSFVEYGGVRPNPSVELSQNAAELCRREGIDCILAIGGGSVIDSAKAIALGACRDSKLWDIYSGKSKIPDRALPIGVIITIPATGSEANGVSVLSNYGTKDKRAISNPLCIPSFAILNPELTKGIPRYETAVAAADIFSHCFERYFDLRRESRIWNSLCEAAMKTIVEVTPKLLDDLENYELRSELMWSATVAHSNILGPGGDFACHALAHPLTIQYQIPHGAALALIMPEWSRSMSLRAPDQFLEFARNVWNADTAEEGIQRLSQFLNRLGLPMKLADAGVDTFRPEELVQLAFAHGEEFLGGGFERIFRPDAEAIYQLLR